MLTSLILYWLFGSKTLERKKRSPRRSRNRLKRNRRRMEKLSRRLNRR
jgi:hypothetical protein